MQEAECTPNPEKRVRKAKKEPSKSVNFVISLGEDGKLSFGHDAVSNEQVYLIVLLLNYIKDGSVYQEICRQSPELRHIMTDDMWGGNIPYIDLTDDANDDESE